jgi:hypothetical protein
MALLFTIILHPKPENREDVEALCKELVGYAEHSRDCDAAMYGRVSGDREPLAISFVFGSMGPFHRFTSQRETNGPYRDFRKQVMPLLTRPLSVQVLVDMDGFVAAH